MRRFDVSLLVQRQISLLICCVGLLLVAVPGQGQSGIQATDVRVSSENAARVEKAIEFICQDRARDPKATVPIDKMASQPLMPLTMSRVMAGRDRAHSMLPVAKRLLPFALSHVAASNGLEPLSSKWILERVSSITAIRPDVSEGDNASWRPSEPNAIVFGTVFLDALRSNEAMLAVLAHEITHAINGTDNALQPIVKRVGQRTSVGFASAEELVCELVAIEVVRDYISQTSSQGSQNRRLARSLQKNCVSVDLSDAHHLSPRHTMRTLITLDPKLTFKVSHNPKSKQPKQKRVRTAKRNQKRR
jgi:hypothetical protein